jgi:hypothetical protein
MSYLITGLNIKRSHKRLPTPNLYLYGQTEYSLTLIETIALWTKHAEASIKMTCCLATIISRLLSFQFSKSNPIA